MIESQDMNQTRIFQHLAVSVAILLAGCSMMPVYERPAAPIAADWPALSTTAATPGSESAANGSAAADTEWQDFFSDTRLRQLIDIALRNNRDLRVAVLNIEQARALFQIRQADQFPAVGAALTGSRQPAANEGITSIYTAGLAMTSYEFDFFGRVASLKEAALGQYLATLEGRKTAQISLIAAVASTYLSLLADEELIGITRQTLATREDSYRLSKLRFDSGVASELDVRQAEQLLRASNANIGAARAAFFPRIALTASAGSASSHLGDLFKSGSFGWTLAPQLLLPIFDAGRNRAGLDTASAGRDIAVAQYEKSIQIAFREVADALAGRATLGEQLRASQAQAAAEGVRYRLSNLRYQGGIASQLDLLDAQRSLFTAQQAVVQTRLAQLQSQLALYRALGGGWKEPGEAAALASAVPVSKP